MIWGLFDLSKLCIKKGWQFPATLFNPKRISDVLRMPKQPATAVEQ
jgi:hypothetical protein